MRVRDLIRALANHDMDEEIQITVCVGESDNAAAVAEVEDSEALSATADEWDLDIDGAFVLRGYYSRPGGAA